MQSRAPGGGCVPPALRDHFSRTHLHNQCAHDHRRIALPYIHAVSRSNWPRARTTATLKQDRSARHGPALGPWRKRLGWAIVEGRRQPGPRGCAAAGLRCCWLRSRSECAIHPRGSTSVPGCSGCSILRVRIQRGLPTHWSVLVPLALTGLIDVLGPIDALGPTSTCSAPLRLARPHQRARLRGFFGWGPIQRP
jgi:hypothetical protein